MIKHFQTRSVREDHRLEVNASMADEARLAPALTGVTERLDAHDDAHEADDDGVSLTRSEGTKHYRRANEESKLRGASVRDLSVSDPNRMKLAVTGELVPARSNTAC